MLGHTVPFTLLLVLMWSACLLEYLERGNVRMCLGVCQRESEG